MGLSSPLRPLMEYENSIELQKDVADLWWTIDRSQQAIVIEFHMKTTGWVGLGISPEGTMTGADIVVGWVEPSGLVGLQDRYAITNTRPIVDNTTHDWFLMDGREQNGWTGIQLQRLLDTGDKLDVPIKFGSNIVIFAYGLVDLDSTRPEIDITYHQNRRNTRIITF